TGHNRSSWLKLLQLWVSGAADRSLAICCVQDSNRIAEERTRSTATVSRRNGRKLVFCGCAGSICADDDVAEYITVLASVGKIFAKQTRLIGLRRSLRGRSHHGQRVWQTCIPFAIGFHSISNLFHAGDGGFFIDGDFGLVPLFLKRRQVEQQQSERE